jgi:hypothetical protein
MDALVVVGSVPKVAVMFDLAPYTFSEFFGFQLISNTIDPDCSAVCKLVNATLNTPHTARPISVLNTEWHK